MNYFFRFIQFWGQLEKKEETEEEQLNHFDSEKESESKICKKRRNQTMDDGSEGEER